MKSIKRGATVVMCGLLAVSCASDDDASEPSDVPVASASTMTGDDSASGSTTPPETTAPSGSEPADANEPTDSSDVTTTTEAEALPELDRDATFTWASLVYPSHLSPHRVGFSGASQAVLMPLHDRLVYLDPLTGELGPMLATSWEASDDATSITFELRDDVTFHDGSPFDAGAVVANVEYAQAQGAEHVNAAAYALIEQVTAVDSHTVRYDLTGAYAGGLLEQLSQGLGAFVAPETLDVDDPAATVGTGPYMVSEVTPGQAYELTAYPDYWDPAVQNFATLRIVVETSEDTILNGVAGGQYDAARLPASATARAEQTAGVQAMSELSNTAMVWTLNNALVEGGDDPRVLEAINVALDRDEIGNGALRGECVPTVQPWNESHPGHHPDYPADHYGSDPERARELLAEAGYPDGISISIDTYTIPAIIPVAEVIQSQLGEAGIDATINQHETTVLISGFVVDKSLDSFLSLLPFYQPPTGLVQARWMETGGSNPGGWHDDEIDRLFPELMATADVGLRSDLLQQISARLVEAPSNNIVICHEVPVWVAAERVVGLQPLPFGYDFRRFGVAAG